MEDPASRPEAVWVIEQQLQALQLTQPHPRMRALDLYRKLHDADQLSKEGDKNKEQAVAILALILYELHQEEQQPPEERPLGLSPAMRIYNALEEKGYIL